MKEIKKIIVIRFRRVGDAVISTVLCTSLKKSFPQASIHYVLNESIAPLFENHPDIDKLITFNPHEMAFLPSYLNKVRKIMKEGKYDLLVDTRATLQTLWFSFFSLSTPFRIGKRKKYSFFLHNYRPDIEGITDEVNKTLHLLSPLEKYYTMHYERRFTLYPKHAEIEQFARYMQSVGIQPDKPVMVCAVTARLIHKVWPSERMREVITLLLEKYDVQLVFNYGSKIEKDFALQLHADLNYHPQVFIEVEAKNLRQLMALLANSQFFFGNEGGPRHISQALGIPSFAIYPPRISKAQWLPNAGELFQGIEPQELDNTSKPPSLSYQEQFNLITVERVWEKLDQMLKHLDFPKREP